ncbi:hypothetical protein [Brevundimonas sp.]|nr:hypothetical protein [Brevundimonas sp.]
MSKIYGNAVSSSSGKGGSAVVYRHNLETILATSKARRIIGSHQTQQ